MKAKDLIEGFKKKEYGWDEEAQTYGYAGLWEWGSPWKEGEITLYAVDDGGYYDVTSDLRVEFRDGAIELIRDDKTYNCDYDLIKTVTHRVKLVEKGMKWYSCARCDAGYSSGPLEQECTCGRDVHSVQTVLNRVKVLESAIKAALESEDSTEADDILKAALEASE
jgi:hypothetical protein